eukprot:c21982_g2_i2 orf=694-1230(+)
METYADNDLHTMSSEAVSKSSAVAEKGRTTMEVQRANQAVASVAEVEQMKCECCGLMEDCTPAYVSHVRGVHCGRWVCGLCAEAVKEELGRGLGRVNEGMEDALKAHMGICMQFNRREKRGNPVADIASAMRRLLRRSVDGSTLPHSAPSSPRRGGSISRTNSGLTPFSRGRGYEAPL